MNSWLRSGLFRTASAHHAPTRRLLENEIPTPFFDFANVDDDDDDNNQEANVLFSENQQQEEEEWIGTCCTTASTSLPASLPASFSSIPSKGLFFAQHPEQEETYRLSNMVLTINKAKERADQNMRMLSLPFADLFPHLFSSSSSSPASFSSSSSSPSSPDSTPAIEETLCRQEREAEWRDEIQKNFQSANKTRNDTNKSFSNQPQQQQQQQPWTRRLREAALKTYRCGVSCAFAVLKSKSTTQAAGVLFSLACTCAIAYFAAAKNSKTANPQDSDAHLNPLKMTLMHSPYNRVGYWFSLV